MVKRRHFTGKNLPRRWYKQGTSLAKLKHSWLTGKIWKNIHIGALAAKLLEGLERVSTVGLLLQHCHGSLGWFRNAGNLVTTFLLCFLIAAFKTAKTASINCKHLLLRKFLAEVLSRKLPIERDWNLHWMMADLPIRFFTHKQETDQWFLEQKRPQLCYLWLF